MPDAPIVAGTWTAQVQGDYIVIKNKYASRQTIVLLDDGFIFIGSRGTSLRVTRGEQAEEVTLEDALALLPGLDVAALHANLLGMRCLFHPRLC